MQGDDIGLGNEGVKRSSQISKNGVNSRSIASTTGRGGTAENKASVNPDSNYCHKETLNTIDFQDPYRVSTDQSHGIFGVAYSGTVLDHIDENYEEEQAMVTGIDAAKVTASKKGMRKRAAKNMQPQAACCTPGGCLIY